MQAPTRLGKYQVRRELGRGAMGIVYEALDPGIDRVVAIKVLHVAGADAGMVDELRERFRREARIAGQLNSPHIVGIYDIGDAELAEGQGAEPFIVMELIRGQDLKARQQGGQRLALPEIVHIMSGLLAGLGHAHAKGVVHRDIKPANVILCEDGTVKVADFGIARIDDSQLTRTGTVMGTVAYMSPEQLTGAPLDLRSDLYACGVVLYELLTGEAPFIGSSTTIMQKILNQEPLPPTRLNPGLPLAMDEVLRRALAKSPAGRYGSATEFALALQQAAREGVAPVVDHDATVVVSRPVMPAGITGAFPGTSPGTVPGMSPGSSPGAGGSGSWQATAAMPAASGTQPGTHPGTHTGTLPGTQAGTMPASAPPAPAAMHPVIPSGVPAQAGARKGWLLGLGGAGVAAAAAAAAAFVLLRPAAAPSPAPGAALPPVAAASVPVPAPASATLHIDSATEIEQQAWDAAEAVATPAAFHAYLKAYPDGRFAAVAQVRLAADTKARAPGNASASAAAAALAGPASPGATTAPRPAGGTAAAAGASSPTTRPIRPGTLTTPGTPVAEPPAVAPQRPQGGGYVWPAPASGGYGTATHAGGNNATSPAAAAHALADCEAKAKAGDVACQLQVGHAYREGRGVSADPAQALLYFRMAADQGDAIGLYQAAQLMLQGPQRNEMVALRWLRKSADRGHAPAQVALGLAHERGDIGRPNAVLAAEWFRKAADSGNAQGQYQLGRMYQGGLGVFQDSARAAALFRQAADQGDAEAAAALRNLKR